MVGVGLLVINSNGLIEQWSTVPSDSSVSSEKTINLNISFSGNNTYTASVTPYNGGEERVIFITLKSQTKNTITVRKWAIDNWFIQTVFNFTWRVIGY